MRGTTIQRIGTGREGRADASIHDVGNVMIDALERHLPTARKRNAIAAAGLSPRGYAVLTLHRPSNVDEPATLARLLEILGDVTAHLPVIFPVHPRTQARFR